MSKKTVYPGVYFDDEAGRYFYRPWVNEKRKERWLKARTQAEAIKEFIKLDARKDAEQSVGELVKLYLDAGAPTDSGEARHGEFTELERARLNHALPFWKKRLPCEIEICHCVEYRDWRVDPKRMRKGCLGLRSVDMELTTLSNVFRYSILLGKIKVNPIASRPKFDNQRSHCRDHCPRSGDELHTIASRLAKRRISQALVWQMLFEACSGCRTGEVVPLRWDAAPAQPGHIRDGQYLCIHRLKQEEDVDPYDYIVINPALKIVLEAMKNWNDETAQSAWFFPSSKTDGPVFHSALCNAIRRVSKKLLPGRRITSHGMRAFYVTWQRTSGRPMTQIADDLGHVSGIGLIYTTYGRRPPAWASSDCTPFPKTVAAVWEKWLKRDGKIVRLKVAGE